MASNKRLSFANFPIPFDHPYTLPSLIAAVAASSFAYYYLQSTHTAELIEAVRVRDINKRRQLKRPEQRFASLKVERRYVNPFGQWREVPWWETALFWLCRYKGNGLPKTEEELNKTMPVVKPSLDVIFAKSDKSSSGLTASWVQLAEENKDVSRSASSPSVAFTWLGQSTCLIRVDNITILTDPVFSKCSINDYLGPKRLRPIPCSIDEIASHLDMVLVSHDHFDHLDESVVHKLGNSVTWYIPLGLRDWFVKRGVENVIELDWWQEIHHAENLDTKIACVPAMHWSGSRTPFDKNSTLWCSFVVKTKSNSIFFCGDTGYCPELFKAIGEQYAPFTLAAIPIGSFKPEILMQHLHMGPTDAVKVHHDIGCPKLSVGIHWGTFMMSDEHYLEPARQLKEAWDDIDIQRTGGKLIRAAAADGEQESSSFCSTTATVGAVVSETRFITTFIGETVCLN
ncbi:beta-lactamase superfamily domain-containing protein [Zychaea mexicana]|uniref:beta-lactamase superfamily domain-containing protein n=1 Tax=Zychaea mexicana TaxID=64656 RepID=UPI0022FDF3ED|nr:beta-lactamase superfamily domain-containing protein [Zychaea mexicana]KAI9496901.1 beta-lactamase superfamily domain-containing protein [Zychaea mexicana]